MSRSITAGINFSPTAIKGLTGSVNFWQVHIDGVVSTYPAPIVLSTCPQSGDPVYRAQLLRDPATNYSLQGATVAGGGYIVQTNQNIASVLQSGIDLQTGYKWVLPPRLAAIDWSFYGTYLLHATQTTLVSRRF